MGTKISELDVAPDALDGTELLPVVQDGVTYRATALQVGRIAAVCSVDGATGALQYSSGVLSAARTGAGAYTITTIASYTLGTVLPFATPSTSSARHATVEVSGTTTFAVKCFDAAGAATDTGFHLLLVAV